MSCTLQLHLLAGVMAAAALTDVQERFRLCKYLAAELIQVVREANLVAGNRYHTQIPRSIIVYRLLIICIVLHVVTMVGDEISKELHQCSKLIRKVELEVDLNDALTLSQVPTYDYDGWNDQPEYNSLSDLANSIDDLRSVLSDLDALSDDSSYHKELQEKIKFARIVCNGRALVATKECRSDIDWERCLEEFEDSIAVAMGQSTSIPDYVVQEYEIMTGEFIRRNLLVGFNDVLCTTCVVGEVDIDIAVSEEVLKKVFSKYNSLALFMSQNFEEYPNNLKALSMFVVHVLKLRRNVFEGAWDSSIRELLDQISVCNHGGRQCVLADRHLLTLHLYPVFFIIACLLAYRWIIFRAFEIGGKEGQG